MLIVSWSHSVILDIGWIDDCFTHTSHLRKPVPRVATASKCLALIFRPCRLPAAYPGSLAHPGVGLGKMLS